MAENKQQSLREALGFPDAPDCITAFVMAGPDCWEILAEYQSRIPRSDPDDPEERAKIEACERDSEEIWEGHKEVVMHTMNLVFEADDELDNSEEEGSYEPKDESDEDQ